MTVIAALVQGNTVVIGGDRAASDNASRFTMSRPKIWSSGEYLMGYCGTLEGEHLQSKFSPPPVIGEVDLFMQDQFLSSLDTFYEKWHIFKDQVDERGMGMLICVGGYIYEHDPAFMTMTRYETPFLSIGSGSQYALGSLHSTHAVKNPRTRVKIAIEAACEYSLTCGLPLDLLSMKIKGEK
jgi:ATP-dependent protease HslVU (ClpYQ) peptidase subunit